ncbi:signal peptide peptidase SppA [Campylobacter sp. MIT 97-5078]|uniref:signal peptide peptidase SppA n=1 Tax=Campylobacter sp. MIT 97-5078 TaxID=1548153 RepID=UPI0005130710|nr:signal peptide peptidase SppA [Campylobacter sp. MIT 97-5078]KGI56408.1 endopeptidase IV [Campylobacter sp. MIT 97-5078]KGI57619.1 endopeptidase IV [Campylobacter sp. MIT 97-5078]KGI57683.1 endopeptidase IV [Campylobacter sp. MIT 97-5078]TQR26623.1 signal peptide peptidase SppA [Campylobacter sp. MIT 97-5078]
MQFLKSIFKSFGACIRYINTYFKTFVFLFIIALIILPSFNSKASLNNLAKVELSGEIINVNTTLEALNKLKDDENIKGVLFIIDSPGGLFAPSMELALAVKDLQAKKPVVVYASGTMASGSYLAGVGANEIIANPASFIGSIGVIMQGADLSELANKLGIKPQVIKAGKYKEAGTFTRAWSEQERAYLQELITQSYELFTEFVAKERNLKLEEKDKWANARVFLSDQARKLGLIDELGNLETAKKRVEELAKVENPSWKELNAFDKFLNKLNTQALSFSKELLSSLLLSSNQFEAR